MYFRVGSCIYMRERFWCWIVWQPRMLEMARACARRTQVRRFESRAGFGFFFPKYFLCPKIIVTFLHWRFDLLIHSPWYFSNVFNFCVMHAVFITSGAYIKSTDDVMECCLRLHSVQFMLLTSAEWLFHKLDIFLKHNKIIGYHLNGSE